MCMLPYQLCILSCSQIDILRLIRSYGVAGWGLQNHAHFWVLQCLLSSRWCFGYGAPWFDSTEYLFSPPTASSNHSRTRSFHLPVFCLKEDKVGWLGDSGILSIHSSPKCGWAHGAFWSSSTAFLLWARWVNWFVSLCLDVFGSVSSAKCQKVPQFQFRMIAPWAPNASVLSCQVYLLCHSPHWLSSPLYFVDITTGSR